MAKKKVVVNKVLNTFVSEFIKQLFQPQWSPKRANEIETNGRLTIEPIPVYTDQDKQHQPLWLPNFPYNATKNPHSVYDGFSDASSMFLVTEDWFIFLDALQAELKNFDTNTFIHWIYNNDGSLNTGSSFVDELAEKFPNQKMEIELGQVKGYWDKRTSQNLVEFFLRHVYSLRPEARELAIRSYGEKFGIDVNVIDRATLSIIPFVNFDPDKFEINLQDDGLLTFNYAEPIKLERRFEKSELDTLGLNVDKVYLMFPQVNACEVEGYCPTMYYDKSNFIGEYKNGPTDLKWSTTLKNPSWMSKFLTHDDSGKPVYKDEMPYVALSLGSTEENSDATNPLKPYNVVTDHTDIIDYLDNLVFNINTPKNFK